MTNRAEFASEWWNFTVMATLNHDLAPNRRADMHPAPTVIGRNVWVGSNVTILPRVTIGDNAVVAAASVVRRAAATPVANGRTLCWRVYLY
jgi:acetyltransferase-like isoleucine patch superfamily enzyme